MRTSFIVGIFGLAVTVAGITEWASRRAPGSQRDGSPDTPASIRNGPGPGPSDIQPALFRESSSGSAEPRDADNAAEGVTSVLVLAGTAGGFRVNAVSLPEAITDRIDQLFTGADASELACAEFVIEGHTDNLGSSDVNEKIGLARALAVREYLSEQYQIPRDMMRVVSYGADRPVGDNATPEGRLQNRRVVIRMVPDAGHD